MGVGVIGVSSLLGGNATVVPGFDYDPRGVRAGGGMNPFPGAAVGRANLADLLVGRDVIEVNRALAGGVPAQGDELTILVNIAVPAQFFTPGGFSGTITLIVAE
jgi:hypothetical protein